MAVFEFFSKEPCVIKGKHADYADAMWKQNNIQASCFKRLVDLYTIAAIIGLRTGRKAEEDTSTDSKRTVQLDAIATCRTTLSQIMKLIIIFDESDGKTPEERIEAAFRIPETEEVYKRYMNLFNSYVRGGIEYIYEQIVRKPATADDDCPDGKVSNMLSFLKNPLKKEYTNN
ncbi:MAG: hypothetical protein K6G81_12980 [Lachnospiraceae bacterium]|nr:hypothetical protein [Lachnospiraceae bacterium]